MDLHHLPVARRPVLLHRAFVTFGSLELCTAHLPFPVVQRGFPIPASKLNAKLITIVDAGIILACVHHWHRPELVSTNVQWSVYHQSITIEFYHKVPGQSGWCVVPNCSGLLGPDTSHYPYCTEFAEVTVLQRQIQGLSMNNTDRSRSCSQVSC
jgi:hypothetical protein